MTKNYFVFASTFLTQGLRNRGAQGHAPFQYLEQLQGVPYVLGRTLESLGPIMLTFWIFLLNYAKKQTFQWLIWCKLLFCSCTFIKDTGENVQHHFATLLYNLISKITIVIQTYKKSLNDQKWDLNWILGHWVQFWVLKR